MDRTNAYLNNLFRLGLVWFSREEVEPQRYQVVEVQPEVQEAMARAGRAPKTIRQKRPPDPLRRGLLPNLPTAWTARNALKQTGLAETPGSRANHPTHPSASQLPIFRCRCVGLCGKRLFVVALR